MTYNLLDSDEPQAPGDSGLHPQPEDVSSISMPISALHLRVGL